MSDWQQRTRLLLGDEGVLHLAGLHVLLVGVGGVGGHVAEVLVRAGIGQISLVDMDVVSDSNRNRQLVALSSSVGLSKVSVIASRLHDINPACHIRQYSMMLCQDAERFLLDVKPDIVVDAIDSLSCKVALIIAAKQLRLPIYSSMGAGRRIDPTQVRVMDVMDTSGCGLARQVRSRLRKAGIGKGVLCVASSEKPFAHGPLESVAEGRDRVVNGTISYMPALFGTMLAGKLLMDQINDFAQSRAL